MNKKLLCKEWVDAIARYQKKEFKGYCDTCLYTTDAICPAGILQKEKNRYIKPEVGKGQNIFLDFIAQKEVL